MLASTGVAQKIKILFSVPRFSVGGAEKFLINHLATIDRSKYDVTLITLFDEQREASCAHLAHIDRCFHFRSTWDMSAFLQLVSFLRAERFDVIVTHLFSANLLVRAAAILAGAPAMISYEHNIYPNKRRWQIFIDRLFSKWTGRIIADSDAAKRFTSEQESIPLGKFTTIIIPPLLDSKKRRTREELRAAFKIPEGSMVVTCVSRLVIDKGHTYLIDASATVLRKHPAVYFIIGGWGPLHETLQEQAKKLGIEDNVQLPGKVDGQEFLALSDLYVDPSISTDLPIGIMEAMREGKPIVATSVGEIPNFVMHERTGLIVPPGSPQPLAEAIIRMLEDAALRERLGKAAKEKCAEYSMENYLRTFDSIVDELLAR